MDAGAVSGLPPTRGIHLGLLLPKGVHPLLDFKARLDRAGFSFALRFSPLKPILVHQVRGWYSGAVAELAILEGASEGPYLD